MRAQQTKVHNKKMSFSEMNDIWVQQVLLLSFISFEMQELAPHIKWDVGCRASLSQSLSHS